MAPSPLRWHAARNARRRLRRHRHEPHDTMKSIVANNGGIGTVSEDMILGALSLVIWTMTLVTTVKYVVIAMKADNHNEGRHLRPV